MPTFASSRLRNHCSVKHSSRNFPLNDSSVPFCHGLPGSMNAVSICAVCSQRRIAVRHELGAVVGAQVARRPVHAHELRQHLDHAPRPNAAGHIDRQALARELIDDRQALQRAAVRAGVEHEVVRPDVIDRRSAAAAAAGWSPRVAAAASSAPAAPPGARADTSARRSSRGPAAPRKIRIVR